MQAADFASTASGSVAGMTLIGTTQWDQIPHGQLVRLATGVLLILAGYFMYRGNGGAHA